MSKREFRFSRGSILLLVLLFGYSAAAGTRNFDVLIRGGDIVDGSGMPRYRADVAVQGDTIVGIGRYEEAVADRVIDAGGRVVAPGFIDMHAHLTSGYDLSGIRSSDPRRRAAQNFVAQGITSAVVNPDGFQGTSLVEQIKALDAQDFGVNVIPMNGHSWLRDQVMPKGDRERPADPEEIRRMQDILRADMAEGRSFGMSLGLEYGHARYASVEEQVALARVLAAYNGVFIPHLRSSGPAPMWYWPSRNGDIRPPTLEDSIEETLLVAEATGATVVFTHMKALGAGYRGQAETLVQRMQSARDRGARVFMDVYPYTSSGSDGSFVALPDWIYDIPGGISGSNSAVDYRAAFEKGWEQASPRKRKELAADLRHKIALKGGIENILLLEHPNPVYVGKSYAELMAARGLGEVELAIVLQQEGNPHWKGGARMRSFSMDERDLVTFYKLDWCSVSTDGWVVLPEEAIAGAKYAGTNRRAFGTYPRRLAYFSRELGVDSLEHAIRAASGLPAEILNIRDRGRLAVGMKADIVVLDMETLGDRTTELEPSVYPAGVEHVLVNGRLVVDAAERTMGRYGVVLKPVIAGER